MPPDLRSSSGVSEAVRLCPGLSRGTAIRDNGLSSRGPGRKRTPPPSTLVAMRVDFPLNPREHPGTNSNVISCEFPLLGHRILIWGGGGKTMLGKALSARLGLPFVELDALHWLPDWQERPGEEFRQLVHETLDDLGDSQGDGWVVDGQYGGKLGPLVLERADTLIWLQLPWRVIFWRTFKRAIRRARDKNLICGENVESWRQSFFSRDSLLLWYIKLRLGGGYKRSLARREERLRESGHHVTVIRLTSARQLDEFYAAHELVRPTD